MYNGAVTVENSMAVPTAFPGSPVLGCLKSGVR